MEHKTDESRELKACINNLVSMLALPAIWSGRDSSEIGTTLLDALAGVLHLNFAYVRLNHSIGNGAPFEKLQLAQCPCSTSQRDAFGRAINSWLSGTAPNARFVVPNPSGNGDISVAFRYLGIHDQVGELLVGSVRADFPTETEKLLLDVAANQAVIGLHESHRRVEQKRLAEELDRRVAEQTRELRDATEALRASEERLRLAVQASNVGLWDWDLLTNQVTFSREWKSQLGYREDEIGNDFSEWERRVHPDDLAAKMAALNACVDGTSAEYAVEFRLRHKDGAYRWIYAQGEVLRDASGKAVRMLGCHLEITKRKEAEEAQRRAEAYLAESQRLNHTGSWASDATRKVVYFSEEMSRMFGFDPKQGTPTAEQVWQRIHPDDRARVRELSDRTYHEKLDYESEFRFVLPDGTIKHIHAIGHPVLNAKGEVVEVLGTDIDVTERKRAEQELRDSETRFRTYVDHATDAFFVQDGQGRIVDVNRKACESLGYTREELIGMTPLDFDSAIDDASLRQIADRVNAGEVVAFETSHRRKDGYAFPVEVRSRPFWLAGSRLVMSVARDITERKRAEEEREKLRQLEADLAHVNRVSMLGELAASLAHELKQPIAAAVTNANTCMRWLARKEPDLQEARETAMRIVEDGKRAAEIIDRLRSFYKKGAPAERELVDVNGIIREMTVLLRSEANRFSIPMHTDVAAELPRVSADRVQLQQVLMNLMLNAIEAMKDIGGELTVKSQLGPDRQVMISVSDTGVGLPAEKADQIFNAFFTTKPQGSGMGLAISRSIVESHGGRLWATANVGRGATFHFSLPVAVGVSNAPAIGR